MKKKTDRKQNMTVGLPCGTHYSHVADKSAKPMVPKAGLEPARLAAGDFESPASTIPPLGHNGGLLPCNAPRGKSNFTAFA